MMITNDKLDKVNTCVLGKSIYKLIEGDGFNPCNSCDVLHTECKHSDKISISGVLCKLRPDVKLSTQPKLCRSCGRTTATPRHVVEYVGKLHDVEKCYICGAEYLSRHNEKSIK